MFDGAQKIIEKNAVRAEMNKIPVVAENIYFKQRNYKDVNCEHQSMRVICDEIKKLTGNEPIIHTSKERFCTYAKLSSQDKYFCIESARTPFLHNTYYVSANPAETGYCDGKTFICPPEEKL